MPKFSKTNCLKEWTYIIYLDYANVLRKTYENTRMC